MWDVTTGKVLGRLTGHRGRGGVGGLRPGRSDIGLGRLGHLGIALGRGRPDAAGGGRPAVRLTPPELAKLWADLGSGAVPAS